MAEADRDDLVSIIEDDNVDAEIPDILPMMPVRDVVVFTDMVLPLFVGREKSVRAVQEAVAKDGYLFLATQKDPAIENPNTEEIFNTGTVSRVLRMLKLPDGNVKILVQGFVKAKITRYTRKRSLYRVKFETIEEPPVDEIDLEIEALMRNVREHCEKILVLRGEIWPMRSNCQPCKRKFNPKSKMKFQKASAIIFCGSRYGQYIGNWESRMKIWRNTTSIERE
jgi:ATP-dependent Lon protease